MNLSGNDGFWYALHVRPRFEKVVARNLHGKGYEEYLPLYHRRSRWSDRIKDVELPLFPGYVFCRFNVLQRLPVLMIPGVHTIVGIGKTPLAVNSFELDSIRAVLASGSHYEPWPFMEVGEKVQVEYGPLAGTNGIVTMLKNSYRLVISVNLLQRSVAVEIDRECLKPIGNGQSAQPRIIPNTRAVAR